MATQNKNSKSPQRANKTTDPNPMEAKASTRLDPKPAYEVMTVEEVASYLNLAVATIYQKVSERSIPYTKIRNILRFQKNTIDEWLLQNTVYPEPNTFEEFARWYSRHVFKEWLKSKGKKPQDLSQKELNELARQSLNDVLVDEGKLERQNPINEALPPSTQTSVSKKPKPRRKKNTSK